MCLGINGTSSIHTVHGINGIIFIIKANQLFNIKGPVLLRNWTFCAQMVNGAVSLFFSAIYEPAWCMKMEKYVCSIGEGVHK
jgi:succinate dehydrogenase/fumarate reductase cytochrome b subunit